MQMFREMFVPHCFPDDCGEKHGLSLYNKNKNNNTNNNNNNISSGCDCELHNHAILSQREN